MLSYAEMRAKQISFINAFKDKILPIIKQQPVIEMEKK